ncbi:patatin-like phospholipase family protein [Flavicella sediminum]|uniref:patatin-like phospholipase family protein n=1 Tax=Flavicella sediminum TaxID=2585141 RepID=UPI00111EA195|nr:patatin-like phospholipase family protein [Flavicella sediminum]
MKALVISGGGSKGAFAGGVAEYLIKTKKKKYDLYLGTSTGSLLIPHLALGKIEELKEIYTNVNQRSIFDNSPFFIKKLHGEKVVAINHLNVLWNLIRKRKTFGESGNLRKLIRKNLSNHDFLLLKTSTMDLVVTVSNLTTSQIEYKSIHDYSYDEFCDWIWASCNYAPFMSVFEKNYCEYVDGGFGCLVPVREAINRGATEVDVIILDTEVSHFNRLSSKNPFSLISNIFDFALEQVEKHNLTIGKLAAKNNNVKLNMYYTPTVLTTNSLIFDKEKMTQWWKDGYSYMEETYGDQMTHIKYDK